MIERHNESINSICQLDDGTIVSSLHYTIMIGDYTIKNAHNERIWKVIALPNNKIASCSNDYTIKIWKNNIPIKVLEGHSSYVTSLLYIKERDIMISGADDGTLRLWNTPTFQCVTMIEGVECLDKDRVIVCG